MLIKVPEGQDIEFAGEGALKEILVARDKALLLSLIHISEPTRPY